MKKLIVASILAALPFSAEAADLSDSYVFIEDSVEPLAPSVVGHLELSGGWWRLDQDGQPSNDRTVLDGAGRVNIPFAGNWNLELEAVGTYLFVDEPQDDQYIAGGYSHLWAGIGDLRFGAFGGADHFHGPISDVTFWVAGAEAEIDVGSNLTLGVQGSYGDRTDGCANCDFVYVVGWADFYPMPNTKIGVQGGWSDLVSAPLPDSSAQFWSVWGTVEQRFGGTPLSLFVRGGYEANFDQNTEFYSVAGGLRIFFDGNALTLQEHDHQVPFEYRLPQFNLLQ
jgi:hypothetical protein